MGGGGIYGTGSGNTSEACHTPANAQEAGRNLARLMERQLGYAEGHIDPVALRLFIRAYWSRVSCYAHTIHDEH